MESCIINSGKTTQYFQLNSGGRRGDPISAYLFIIVMEVLFTLIKKNEKIQGLDITNYCFLFSAYGDNSTFFLRNIDSVIELARTFTGCVCYIITSLFCKSKGRHLWNKEKCFLFHFKSSFHSWDNQILTFQIFKCYDVIKCPSMKHQTHFTE